VPLYNLMEDAATAEISRTQLWQWLHHGGLTPDNYRRILDEELQSIGERPNVKRAAALFDRLTSSDELEDFLTIPAYDELLKLEADQ
jgi:malate synthase